MTNYVPGSFPPNDCHVQIRERTRCAKESFFAFIIKDINSVGYKIQGKNQLSRNRTRIKRYNSIIDIIKIINCGSILSMISEIIVAYRGLNSVIRNSLNVHNEVFYCSSVANKDHIVIYENQVVRCVYPSMTSANKGKL